MKSLILGLNIKNEEWILDQSLALQKPFFDSIVAIDYGSTDRSIQILRSHGATVLEKPWPGNWSIARNAMIELGKSTGADWMLLADADEVWWPGHLRKMRLMINIATQPVISYPRLNLLPGKKWQSWSYPDCQPRLINLREPVEFRGPVHELIHLVGDEHRLHQSGKDGLFPFPAYHYSRLRDPVFTWKKCHNYERLLQGLPEDFSIEPPPEIAAQKEYVDPRGLDFVWEVPLIVPGW
jgi:glycosyltransferase involved in cell wall biosynthesis